jgi:hypothetical protein
MATQLEIVNKALGHISVAPIASMAESSAAAVLATQIWDTCRRECLRGHDWAFATVITALSTANYTIANTDWTYAYQYPSNCVAMWKVYYNEKDKDQAFREVYDAVNSAKVILSNVTDAIGEYTYDLTTTDGYDANFVSVLSYFLAANMAKPLTGDPQLADQMLKMYNAYMSDAERAGSYESDSGKRVDASSAFVDAREGSGLGTDDHYVAVRHPNG